MDLMLPLRLELMQSPTGSWSWSVWWRSFSISGSARTMDGASRDMWDGIAERTALMRRTVSVVRDALL